MSEETPNPEISKKRSGIRLGWGIDKECVVHAGDAASNARLDEMSAEAKPGCPESGG